MARRLVQPVEGEVTGSEEAELASLEQSADARFTDEERVNMRWSRHALDVVREAARLHGVPYQTYVKQVSYRQALTDLKDAQAALGSRKPA
jgi:predicted DNA binding CopG/RHH family protein